MRAPPLNGREPRPASKRPVIAVVDPAAQSYLRLLEPLFPNASFVAATDFVSLGEAADQAEGLITFGLTLTAEQFERFRQLRWLQALSTGVDHLVPHVHGRQVVLTSARGVHGAAVSELAMLLMLALARRLPRMIQAQLCHEWIGFDGALLHGKAVGIIGLGVISAELARKCANFGMEVIAFSNTIRDVPDVTAVRSYADLADTVGELDFLVSVAPLTEQSRRMIDAPLLARVKPGLFFVNVGRGGTVDQEALIDALRKGGLGGAGLDTVDREPLDPASPLWDMDNVILTPHVGGRGDNYVDRVSPLLIKNVAAFLAGDPLTNRVEAKVGSYAEPPQTH